jgi:hypothetical protein
LWLLFKLPCLSLYVCDSDSIFARVYFIIGFWAAV